VPLKALRDGRKGWHQPNPQAGFAGDAGTQNTGLLRPRGAIPIGGPRPAQSTPHTRSPITRPLAHYFPSSIVCCWPHFGQVARMRPCTPSMW